VRNEPVGECLGARGTKQQFGGQKAHLKGGHFAWHRGQTKFQRGDWGRNNVGAVRSGGTAVGVEIVGGGWFVQKRGLVLISGLGGSEIHLRWDG